MTPVLNMLAEPAHDAWTGEGPRRGGLVAEFLEALGPREVTVAGNDTGGAIVQLLAVENPVRVARIALVSCDAFDNFPLGLTGKALVTAGKLPPALFGAFMQQLRLKPALRSPAVMLSSRWTCQRRSPARSACSSAP